MHEHEPRGWPLWCWIALGWMVAATLAAWTWDPFPASAAVASELEQRAPDWDLQELSERELRALPAVGPARARDLVEARWQRPPGTQLQLEEVPGIGPHTATQARAFLAERRRERPAQPVGPVEHRLRSRLLRPGPDGPSGRLAGPSAEPPGGPPAIPPASRGTRGDTLLPHDPAQHQPRR